MLQNTLILVIVIYFVKENKLMIQRTMNKCGIIKFYLIKKVFFMKMKNIIIKQYIVSLLQNKFCILHSFGEICNNLFYLLLK